MLWGGLAFIGARTVMAYATEMDYCSYVGFFFFFVHFFSVQKIKLKLLLLQAWNRAGESRMTWERKLSNHLEWAKFLPTAEWIPPLTKSDVHL